MTAKTLPTPCAFSITVDDQFVAVTWHPGRIVKIGSHEPLSGRQDATVQPLCAQTEPDGDGDFTRMQLDGHVTDTAADALRWASELASGRKGEMRRAIEVHHAVVVAALAAPNVPSAEEALNPAGPLAHTGVADQICETASRISVINQAGRSEQAIKDRLALLQETWQAAREQRGPAKLLTPESSQPVSVRVGCAAERALRAEILELENAQLYKANAAHAPSPSIRRASASGTTHSSTSPWQLATKTTDRPCSRDSKRPTLRGRPDMVQYQHRGHHRLSGVSTGPLPPPALPARAWQLGARWRPPGLRLSAGTRPGPRAGSRARPAAALGAARSPGPSRRR